MSSQDAGDILQFYLLIVAFLLIMEIKNSRNIKKKKAVDEKRNYVFAIQWDNIKPFKGNVSEIFHRNCKMPPKPYRSILIMHKNSYVGKNNQ